MISEQDEALVAELLGQDLSIRQIAKRTGFSRPKVDRIVARLRELGHFEDADDSEGVPEDSDAGEARLDGDPPRVVVPPLAYVGAVRRRDGRMHARWVDTEGSVSDLDIYRHGLYLEYECGDPAARDELDADMARQLVAGGWWECDHYGYHPTWEYGPAPADPRCGCPEHRRQPSRVWSYTPHDRRALAGERYEP